MILLQLPAERGKVISRPLLFAIIISPSLSTSLIFSVSLSVRIPDRQTVQWRSLSYQWVSYIPGPRLCSIFHHNLSTFYSLRSRTGQSLRQTYELLSIASVTMSAPSRHGAALNIVLGEAFPKNITFYLNADRLSGLLVYCLYFRSLLQASCEFQISG